MSPISVIALVPTKQEKIPGSYLSHKIIYSVGSGNIYNINNYTVHTHFTTYIAYQLTFSL